MKKIERINTMHWNGVTQNDRLLKALLPSYVKIDERSTSDMLAFAAKYAQLVHFYNLNLDAEGTWAKFFTNDLSVFIASIVATDLHKIEREHNQIIDTLENASRTEDKLEALEMLFNQVFSMLHRINDWYVHAIKMTRLNPNDSSDLENELENAVKQQLYRNLQTMQIYQREMGFHDRGHYSETAVQDKFHAIWFKTPEYALEAASLTPEQRAVIEQENKILYYTKQVRLQFRTAYSVTAYILQVAPRFFEKSLQEKNDHRPDIALFIAFVETFKHLQSQLNTLTEKHLDFYYYDILRQRERKSSADQVNVFFEVASHIDSHLLPKGTLLTAGADEEGNEIHYATDYELTLNRAQVEELKTVFVSKNPKIGIGSSYRLITNVYAAPIANSKDGQGERFINNEENWPLFGEELLDKPESERQMTFADLGFAVTAPVLEMEEGHRTIQLRFEFDKSSTLTLNNLIKDIQINLGLPRRQDAFAKVFRNSLRVFLTTSEGWYKADSCEVLPPPEEEWDKPEVTIVVAVSASAPAIVGYNPELHGEGFDTTSPVIKVLHANINSIFSYSFLKDLITQRLTIDVTARGLKRIMMSSDLGAIDPSLPFQPFGPLPKVGSYFMLGKAELFKKEITDLEIDIEWHNLPDHSKGLRGHYREYGLGITNDAYQIRLSALSDGTFYPLSSDVPLKFRLFEDHPEQPTNIAPNTKLTNFDLKALNITPDPSFQMPPAFSNEVRAGFMKIELIGPKVAFGHDQYPVVYTNAVTHNANPKSRDEQMPLPKPPFVPQIRSLSMSYSASAQVNVISVGALTKGEAVDEQIYHIHPYGLIRTFHKGKTSNRHLMPTYEDDAYLYIGLRDLNPPTSLSFYFELRDNTENRDLFSAATTKPEVIWGYLADNEWREFSQTHILSDTTNAFNNSGIISLDIPRDLTKDNQILRSGLHWIRAMVKGDPTRMPNVLKVATQAVSATWVNPQNLDGEHLRERLPAESIQGLAKSIAEVRGVFQPFKSFGGRVSENKNEFYTRVSERLRHKNRAVSAWDFERLVLEKFPDIYQVKCVTHLGNESFVPSGTVIVAVVPRIDPDNIADLPRVNYSILQTIKDYLQSLASPFMNIEVRNPIYERVKITAGVRFVKGKNNGHYLKQLNQDILKYMCPWLGGQSRELDLGGFVSKDSLLSFIEKLPYVDFVTKFSAVQVFFDDDQKIAGFDIDDTAIDGSNAPTIQASKPWSVLIPFATNPIYLLDETNFQAPEKSAINSMIIDGDFVMTEEKDQNFDITKYTGGQARRRN